MVSHEVKNVSFHAFTNYDVDSTGSLGLFKSSPQGGSVGPQDRLDDWDWTKPRGPVVDRMTYSHLKHLILSGCVWWPSRHFSQYVWEQQGRVLGLSMYPSSSQQLPHFTKSGVSSSSLSEATAAAMASECYGELSLQAETANVIWLVDHCTRLGPVDSEGDGWGRPGRGPGGWPQGKGWWATTVITPHTQLLEHPI